MVYAPQMFRLIATTGLLFALAAHAAVALDATSPPPPPSVTTNLWTRETLLGDAGGLRSALSNDGITFGIQDTNEVWGNTSGG